MDVKQYVRSGILCQNLGYEAITKYDGSRPKQIILVLEGRCRRSIQLNDRRTLYENYHPISFIGLEDYLLGTARVGLVGAFPGTHYCIWDVEDFYNAISIYPDLARRAIFELSRHIRVYDSQQMQNESNDNYELELHSELGDLDLGDPESDFSEIIMDMSFSENEELPAHLVKKLSRNFSTGEYLMRQGEKSFELYIIHSGCVDVLQKTQTGSKKIDTMRVGDMIGEMAQFDGLPRSADVIAIEPTEALVFVPENFSLLFQLHPRWSIKLLTTLAARLEQRRQALGEMDIKLIKKGIVKK